MADPLIIQTLKQKRAEISGVIAAYQAKIAQARHDLAHINAVIRLVEGGEQERAQYIVSHGFFKKGEIADICLRHLKADGELDNAPVGRASDVRAQARGVRYTAAQLGRLQGRSIITARCATQPCHHGREAEGYLRLVGGRRAHAARCQ